MSIIFAVINHEKDYYNFFSELLSYIKENFSNIESGVQGDAWILIKEKGEKVSLDTFTSMQFEIKSDSKNTLVEVIINIIKKKYPIHIYNPPLEL